MLPRTRRPVAGRPLEAVTSGQTPASGVIASLGHYDANVRISGGPLRCAARHGASGPSALDEGLGLHGSLCLDRSLVAQSKSSFTKLGS